MKKSKVVVALEIILLASAVVVLLVLVLLQLFPSVLRAIKAFGLSSRGAFLPLCR